VSPSHYQGTHCVILSPGYSCYPNIIRVLIVLSYHQGTHCVILILSGYSLCYHPTIIRVLPVLSSHYHQGTHCVILSPGYSLCYPNIIGVLIVLSYYYQGTHSVIILLLSGYLLLSEYSWSYHPTIIRVLMELSSPLP